MCYTLLRGALWLTLPLFGLLGSGRLLAQETLPLQNPLIRPPMLSSGQASPAYGKTPEKTGVSATQQGEDSTDLRAKAAARLTQEDLNVRQQALNASVVPSPLQQIFANMVVAAHARGAIVLRRFEPRASRIVQSEAEVSSAQNRASAPVSQLNMSSSGFTGPNVLRFYEDRIMNISGYRLRARLDGLDVSVDWQNPSGQWINVFFGALESAPGYPTVPAQAALQKPDKQAFKYLQPKLGVQGAVAGSAPYPGSSNQPGGFGGSGQSNMNGFGTAAPIFPN